MPYEPIPSEVTPLSIPLSELCDRYEKLYTGAVNDVLREEHLLYQALPPAIMPLSRTMRAAGAAFTVKGMPSRTVDNEMERRAAMLEALHDRCIVVWDTSQDTASAQWGEVMTKAALRAGCRGAVIDGGVRDTLLVLEQGLPVWSRYRTSNAMLGRFRMVDYQIPVRIGGVDISPGDIILADVDGALVVPRRLAVEVLQRAETICNEEQTYKQWIDDGMSPGEVVRKGGYF